MRAAKRLQTIHLKDKQGRVVSSWQRVRVPVPDGISVSLPACTLRRLSRVSRRGLRPYGAIPIDRPTVLCRPRWRCGARPPAAVCPQIAPLIAHPNPSSGFRGRDRKISAGQITTQKTRSRLDALDETMIEAHALLG